MSNITTNLSKNKDFANSFKKSSLLVARPLKGPFFAASLTIANLVFQTPVRCTHTEESQSLDYRFTFLTCGLIEIKTRAIRHKQCVCTERQKTNQSIRDREQNLQRNTEYLKYTLRMYTKILDFPKFYVEIYISELEAKNLAVTGIHGQYILVDTNSCAL